MTKATIERYFGEECLIPALKAIGYSRQVAAREGMQPHYEDYFEIHLVMDGTVDWWVEKEIYTLRPGSVYITKPGELHGGVQSFVQPCTLNWLQVDPSMLADPTIKQELDQLEERVWIGAGELVEYIDIMLSECRLPKEDSPRVVSAYLYLFLSQLLRQYKNRDVQSRVPPQFSQMVRFIEEALDEARAIAIEDLCQAVDLKRSRVFQLFDQYAGQSPISYINTRRIERAKKSLIETEMQITDIALELGYSSSQHFATAFKRITGLSPREFRRSATQIRQKVDLWREIGKQHQRGHFSDQ